MELRHLETFVAVAEERSFSRAAERLHVVQSAVSATIRNLEAEWGVRLFHRTTHRVELSDAGHALLPEARADPGQAAADIAHAVDEVRGGLRGTIRLGIMQATLGAGGITVAAAISAFRAAHPAVTVTARQGGSAEQAERVRTGELDVAFLGMPDDDAARPEARRHRRAAAALRLHARPPARPPPQRLAPRPPRRAVRRAAADVGHPDRQRPRVRRRRRPRARSPTRSTTSRPSPTSSATASRSGSSRPPRSGRRTPTSRSSRSAATRPASSSRWRPPRAGAPAPPRARSSRWRWRPPPA